MIPRQEIHNFMSLQFDYKSIEKGRFLKKFNIFICWIKIESYKMNKTEEIYRLLSRRRGDRVGEFDLDLDRDFDDAGLPDLERDRFFRFISNTAPGAGYGRC